MSNLAVQFLVALALAAQSANAAVTCAADYTAKASVDDKYCMSDAASCKVDPTCCTAPIRKTCASEAASITCDTDSYNKIQGLTGSDAKAACCVKKATCASATCLDYMEKDTANSDEKCSGGATTCASNSKCCKLKTGTCYVWKKGNTCDPGTSTKPAHWTKTGSDKAACCSAAVKCDTHTCPSTHVLKTGAADASLQPACTNAQCTNDECCQCKSTTCCGAAVTCGTNKYRDNSKDSVVFSDKATDCCTAKAQCKDSATSVGGAPVLCSFWPLFSAFSMLGLVLGH